MRGCHGSPSFLDDVGHLCNVVPGLREYLRVREQRKRKVRKASLGVETRWGYYVDVVLWILEHPGRLDYIVQYLVLYWLGKLPAEQSSPEKKAPAVAPEQDDDDDSDDEDFEPDLHSSDDEDDEDELDELPGVQLLQEEEGEVLLEGMENMKDGAKKLGEPQHPLVTV